MSIQSNTDCTNVGDDLLFQAAFAELQLPLYSSEMTENILRVWIECALNQVLGVGNKPDTNINWATSDQLFLDKKLRVMALGYFERVRAISCLDRGKAYRLTDTFQNKCIDLIERTTWTDAK
jgi:hypothetical protein